jgi:hypothetical protein
MNQSGGPTDSPKAESPAAAIEGIERLDELDLTVVEPATIFHVAESDG